MVLFFILIILAVTNTIIFKISGSNKKNRIISGIIVIVLTPFLFILITIFLTPFDPYGFGTAIIAIISSMLFLLNGIVILIIGLFTKKSS